PPGCWTKACHASCHQRQRLLELRLPRCPLLDEIWLETGFANECQMRPANTSARTTIATPATTPATAAARSTRLRTESDTGSRRCTRDAAPATTIAPATTARANRRPSCARAACV